MQHTVNTTLSARIITFLRSLFPAQTCAPMQESFSIHVPGMGVIGNYTKIIDAEIALHYLPYSIRQRAEILDGDGHCLSR